MVKLEIFHLVYWLPAKVFPAPGHGRTDGRLAGALRLQIRCRPESYGKYTKFYITIVIQIRIDAHV